MNLHSPGAVLLVSCYELGHQPLGIALPMAFLERAGYDVTTLDISVEEFSPSHAQAARFVGISVPMHTALRLGIRVAERVREINPGCHICFYGLYAALNSDYLLAHGADSCIGGEFEEPLTNLVASLADVNAAPVAGIIHRDKHSPTFLKKLDFAAPQRTTLPPLDRYSRLEYDGDCRIAGYVEATRGCLHLCTHCPIPPVYGGRFFALPRDVILQDIRQQVAAGATHITFGDPDFLNGPTHSLNVVRDMHAEFPDVTFDFTAKIEHLLTRGDHLDDFATAGCLFIISAVESLSDRVLTILDKRHTRDDVMRAWKRVHDAGIALRPTWVSFTPWTELADFQEVLEFVETNGLIDHIDPVQYSIRLLIPPGSWLAEHDATLPHRGPLDESAFTYRWTHPDPRMDQLQKDVARVVEEDASEEVDPVMTFFRIKELAFDRPHTKVASNVMSPDRRRAPRMTESWFC